jgi:hypothetical protein
MGRHSSAGTRSGGRGARGLVVWLVAAVVCLPTLACTQTNSCSVAVLPVTFVGRATSIDHGVVAFEVESVTVRQVPVGVTLAVGQPVQVTYESGARYLNVGNRYQVEANLPGQDGNLTSTIATAANCETGTRYADGRSIDTSIISIGGIHTGGIIALIIALALIAVVAWGATVHHGRRRTDQRASAAWKASRSPTDRDSAETPSP